MARTILEIQNEIITKKDTFPTLNELNSTSNVSIWRLWTYVQASAIHTMEVLWDLYREELIDISNSSNIGTDQWLFRKAKEFQYDGITPQILEVTNDFVVQYETIDENLRIITAASIQTLADSSIKIKLAKGVVSNLEPLDSSELISTISYFKQLKMAGQKIDIISLNPDRLYLDANIYFDGQFVESLVVDDIKNALNLHLINLGFDGVLYLQKVVDIIQSVDGIKDVVINEMSGRSAVDNFIDRTQFIKEYNADAGYYVLEDESGFTLIDKLNMIVV